MPPQKPVISDVLTVDDEAVKLIINSDPGTNADAPITFYTVVANDGVAQRVYSKNDLQVLVNGLKPESKYSFKVAATNADGTSEFSTFSKPILTPSAPQIQARVENRQTLSAPAFTLSSNSESRRVSTTATGFSINSTGGAIASFAISPSTPPGMSFSTSTGALSGIPNTVASSTTYTVTARNATGTADATFTLTVTAPPADTVISVAAIGGITNPVTGGTPVSSVTAANGYSGTVTWYGSPTTFAGGSIETATITLTADPGYTLTGVAANFFTVAGANSITHLANSGIITAVFPATLAAPAFTLSAASESRRVNTLATGFTINSSGGTIASLTISPSAPAGMSFDSSNGSFTGTPTSIAGATTYTVTGTNASGSATATFSFTVTAPPADTIISVAAIGGVTVPVTGDTPVTSVTSANGYTGTVSWSGSPATFPAATIETATITLTATAGYTLTGVSANFFTVAGATSVTHFADSGVITAVFPVTGAGVATKAMMTTQPSGAVNGFAFTTQPVVRITDASGNTNSSFTGNVVARIATGTGGTLSGDTTTAAVAGIATFTNLKITGTAGSFTLSFTPAGLTLATSNSFTLTPGSAAKLAVTRAAPTASTSAISFYTQPQVTIRDASNNTVSSSLVVTAVASVGASIVGTSTATSVSGVATFSNLGLTGTEGVTYTITYSAIGLETTTANTYISRACDGSTFACQVGDNGPSGGKIVYAATGGGFTCGPTRSQTCHYIEAAPKGWNVGAEPVRTWAQSSPVDYQGLGVGTINSTETASAVAVGWGYFNTRAIIHQGNTNPATSAAALADTYTVTIGALVIDDWFLPSKDEILYLVQSQVNTGMDQSAYWTSTESTSTRAVFFGLNQPNGGSYGDNSKTYTPGRLVRPVRTF